MIWVKGMKKGDLRHVNAPLAAAGNFPAIMEGKVMPFESIVVLAAVALLFGTFAAGLIWADRQTSEFRD